MFSRVAKKIDCEMRFQFPGESWLRRLIVDLGHGDEGVGSDNATVVCVKEIKDFTSAFLFSLETQHTIG